MIETSLVPPWKSSASFGNLRKMFENVRSRSSSLWNNFGKSSEIFGKWSEIFRKSSKTSLLVCWYNKQNSTWTLGDMEFIFSSSHSISNEWTQPECRNVSTLEGKFHISARLCIILVILYISNRHFWGWMLIKVFKTCVVLSCLLPQFAYYSC